jgi:hypothetical protein
MNGLVRLRLLRIPRNGYISPGAMVTSLSALTRLKYLSIVFRPWGIHPLQSTRRSPPQIRAVLPSLTDFVFQGASEYLNDLVAHIDAPHLQHVSIEYFDWLNFQIGQVPRFISHAGVLMSFDHARVVFKCFIVDTILYPRGAEGPHQFLQLKIQEGLSSLLPSLAEMYSRLSFLLSSVDQLDILDVYNFGTSQVNMYNTQWLELFRPFTAVRTLRVSRRFQSFIMSALQELTGETATAVLPALNNIDLEDYQPYGPEQQGLEHFITARQHSGHPVAIQHLERSPMT